MPDLNCLFLESSTDAILLLDVNGYITYINPAVTAITHFSAAELLGQPLECLYGNSGQDPAALSRQELEHLAQYGRLTAEGWIKCRNTRAWMERRMAPLYDVRRELQGYSCLLIKRPAPEEDRQVPADVYRLLVHQVMDYAIFMLDITGRIISWNDGAANIKGYTATEIIGKHFSIFYPEEEQSTKPAYELEVAVAKGKYEEEGWRIRKDGSRFWANVVVTAVYYSNGALAGFAKVTRDLTARKQTEEIVRNNIVRYRRLAGELKKKNAELSAANEELEQFTFIVSHDLQEPVRTVQSFLTLMQLKIDKGQWQELPVFIAKSLRSAGHMKQLIISLLRYSQLNKGQINKELIPAGALVAEVQQYLQPAIEGAKASVIVDNLPETVYADRLLLIQLLQNLLSNAIKFNQAEKPEVRISGRQEDNEIIFAVADNGIGIAPEDAGKVFEIFRRLHTNTTYSGTGIGLAICKKIVDRHLGRIWLESEPGRGTTFYFSLKGVNSIQTNQI